MARRHASFFLAQWHTDGPDVLVILHGLGAHSGWFNTLGKPLAPQGLTVYAVDHRGFRPIAGAAGPCRADQHIL